MNAPAHTAVPCLRAALHTRIEPPFATGLANWLDRADLAGTLAGQQLAAAVAAHGQVPEATFVASTLLDPSVTTSPQAVERFTTAFEAASGQRLHGLVNAYLCAGWGFVLRHAMRNTRLNRIALCIVDLDLHDLAWQLDHPVIGRAGFGMSSLLFDLPPARETLPDCGGPFANSAFPEFVMALRAHRAKHGLSPTFLPFTQPALHGLAERVLGAHTLAPNHFARWGHCFGSDPWIGLVEWLTHEPEFKRTDEPIRVLAGAIGFNGYYTVSALDVDSDMTLSFHVLPGAQCAAATESSPFYQPPFGRGATTDRVSFGAVLP